MSDTTLPKPTPPTSAGTPVQPASSGSTPQSPAQQPSGSPTPATPITTPAPAPTPVPAAPRPPVNPQSPQTNQTGPQVQKIPMPPTTVTALSSMSSNTIPVDKTPVPQSPQQSIQRPPAALLQQTDVPKASPAPMQPPAQPAMPRPLVTPAPTAVPAAQANTPQTMVSNAPPAPATQQKPPVPAASSPAAPPPNMGNPPQMPPRPPIAGAPPMAPSANKSPIAPTAPVANQPPPSPKPEEVKPKRSLLSFLPIIIGVIVLALGGVFAYVQFFSTPATPTPDVATPDTSQGTTDAVPVRQQVPSEQVTLEYWGLWEQTETMQSLIEEFEDSNPGIKVRYSKQSHIDYRERVQSAVLDGSGPDIFRFHASWVPMYKQILSPLPETVAPSSQMQSDYYPVVTDQLVVNGQYVGLPLMHDSLVLFYNEDILETAAEQPPKTWSELRRVAVKLAVKSGTTLQRGGLAIGNTTNVEHFSDILGTLILQNEGNFAEPNSPQTRDALLFYTNFILKDQVWSEALPSSTVAFARGDVAMMIAPSWRAHEVQAMNPELKFNTAPMPQLSETNRVAWATYWAEGINNSSTKKDAAAQFLAFLSTDANLKKVYSEASTMRNFGPIYPKISLGQELLTTEYVGAVIEDGPITQSWYLNSYTHDNGLNDQMIGYYKIAIDSLIQGGGNIEQVLVTLDEGVSQVLKQYGVTQQ